MNVDGISESTKWLCEEVSGSTKVGDDEMRVVELGVH